MSDVYTFNRALNQEAALVLVADGHTPACEPGGHVVRTGFQMGLDPKTSPGNPRVLVMFLHTHLLTAEEAERGEESPEAREQVLAEYGQRVHQEAREMLPAWAESLNRAGWAAEVSWEGWSVKAMPPRSAIGAAEKFTA